MMTDDTSNKKFSKISYYVFLKLMSHIFLTKYPLLGFLEHSFHLKQAVCFNFAHPM